VENSQIQLVENLDLTAPALNRFVKPNEISKLVAQYGTPLYLIDEDTLHAKVKELHTAYTKFVGPLKIAYSIKANFNPAILRTFITDGITFDLTSIGELHFIKQCKAAPENIIYTSVTEEFEEYLEVLQSGVRKVVVSSFNGMTNLAKAASKIGIKVPTMIRVNPEVGVKAGVRASYRNGKFGVPFNGGTIDSATKMIKHLMDNDLLRFEGFHFHLGSQITDFSCFIHALDKMDAFMTKMKKEYPNFQVNTFDIGGGTPVFYDEPVPSPTQMAENLVSRLNQLVDTHGIFELMIESGRFLVAESSILVSKIVNTKEYSEHKIVILIVSIPKNKVETTSQIPAKSIHLAGRLCDTYDIFPLSKASCLNEADVGRYMSFYNVGAYSLVFNMPFHCQIKPPVIMKTTKGEFKLVRKGTSYERLFIEEGGDII